MMGFTTVFCMLCCGSSGQATATAWQHPDGHVWLPTSGRSCPSPWQIVSAGGEQLGE